MARQLDIHPSLVGRYVLRGMPLSSARDARTWMKRNVRARVTVSPGTDDGGSAYAPEVRPSGYMDARTARERAEAESAQIKVLEARGVLVHRDKVRQELGKRLAGLRESLLQIPARLQSVLAAETDEAKVHDTLQDEIFRALGSVSELEG